MVTQLPDFFQLATHQYLTAKTLNPEPLKLTFSKAPLCFMKKNENIP